MKESMEMNKLKWNMRSDILAFFLSFPLKSTMEMLVGFSHVTSPIKSNSRASIMRWWTSNPKPLECYRAQHSPHSYLTSIWMHWVKLSISSEVYQYADDSFVCLWTSKWCFQSAFPVCGGCTSLDEKELASTQPWQDWISLSFKDTFSIEQLLPQRQGQPQLY